MNTLVHPSSSRLAGQQILVSFIAGLVFSIGLSISGMTQPQNIIAFLDVQNWNPALMFVMVGAIAVYAVAFRLITKLQRPLIADKFEIPTSRVITWQLVVGALVFGIGWGLGGFCGGPALVSLAAGKPEVLIFVVTMFAGMFLGKKLFKS